ncbi:rhodanese-like domain-containing protein [Desulfurispira natronophila]|uniref:Rhodanese-related sulfurtransferase n=1 Tax=Desulfurispira natronophila TaxID=682562 RepID=A0A7W7Y2C1_9BACT|nr:rhodanese-like domain-containing protein [Desulfurispira natronophila]MBB5020810.1 rhodanese-related sulfurtransferase [Desulfurispira natronophila]
MKKILVLFAIIAITFGSTPLWASESELIENRNKMLQEARASVPQISVQDLYKMIEEGQEFVLIDVRDPDEIPNGIVEYENSYQISRGKVEFAAPSRFAKDDPIIVMCLTGGRSSFASQALHDMGYTNVKNVQGGITRWLRAGYPITNPLGSLVSD